MFLSPVFILTSERLFNIGFKLINFKDKDIEVINKYLIQKRINIINKNEITKIANNLISICK